MFILSYIRRENKMFLKSFKEDNLETLISQKNYGVNSDIFLKEVYRQPKKIKGKEQPPISIDRSVGGEHFAVVWRKTSLAALWAQHMER